MKFVIVILGLVLMPYDSAYAETTSTMAAVIFHLSPRGEERYWIERKQTSTRQEEYFAKYEKDGLLLRSRIITSSQAESWIQNLTKALAKRRSKSRGPWVVEWNVETNSGSLRGGAGRAPASETSDAAYEATNTFVTAMKEYFRNSSEPARRTRRR